MRIYLIGLMGSGKTTIGKKLAKKLNYQFVDLDDLIEVKIKMSIADYFATAGEEKFRIVEQETLRETFQLENTVIATGGGTPCFFSNIDEINQNGLSCYLRADAGVLADRLKNAKEHRPLVKNISSQEALKQHLDGMIKAREPFYTQCKTTVEAKNMDVPLLLKALNL
jgi:shikimate kinase